VFGSGLRPPDQDRVEHLTENDLAAYLDHQSTREGRLRVEAHLDACAQCRGEVIALRRIVDDLAGRKAVVRPARHAVRRWWIPVAAAAGLAALLLVPRLGTRAPAPSATERAPEVGGGEGEPRITVVAPAENATVHLGSVAFTWRSAAADVYRVSLLSQSGAPVWSAETSDTSVSLPATVPLQRGEPYFWRVDAIANGMSATTGVHRLQIAP
jgi:anti-sigma factor RsiW